jgi:electron transfer flavoprotein alpha subunit
MGKDLLPRVAALLDTGLITDVTAVGHAGGGFTATKPVFAGKALMQVKATRSPFLATLRPNNFQPISGSGGEVSKAPVTLGDVMSIVKEVTAGSTDRVPLQEAKVVVSGGRGLKGPEHFHLIEELAAALGGVVGASRAVVDAGWRPHKEQVGQTGKTVSPKLYVACGISGAIQHLAGMSSSKCIVAINKDPDAPIFKIADYGIVGDVFDVLPALTAAIKA